MIERISAKENFYYNHGDHVARYIWVSQQKIKGKVLDCGCGEGYGTRWIGEKNVDIYGLDCSKLALSHSRWNDVILANIPLIPFSSLTFDVIISFEVIEHLQDANAYLSKIANTLTPHGIFIGSTPITKPSRMINGKPRNPYHLREYSIHEINALLSNYFEDVQLYGQIFPSKFKGLLLALLKKISILKNNSGFYKIHPSVDITDEKCLWIAKVPKKF